MEILRYDRGTHPKERKYDMKHWNERGPGLLLCLCIAIPCWMLGRALPVIGGPVFAILAGMAIALLVRDKGAVQVLHHHGHGGHWAQYRSDQTRQDRRQTHSDGLVLLGGHHGSEPGHAVRAGPLVKKTRTRMASGARFQRCSSHSFFRARSTKQMSRTTQSPTMASHTPMAPRPKWRPSR